MKFQAFLDRHPALLPAVLLALICVAVANPSSAQTPSLTFTFSTTNSGAQALTPTLTWSTTPAATSCTATGGWTGTKAASGTQTLTPITATTSYSIGCTWPGDTTATVNWVAPTVNTDTSPLSKCATQTETGGSCLQKFVVARGTSAETVGTDSREVNDRNATSYAWTGLTPGTHWFSVIAVNSSGIRSEQSTPPKSKTITASSTQSRTLEIGVRIPAAPTNLAVQ